MRFLVDIELRGKKVALVLKHHPLDRTVMQN